MKEEDIVYYDKIKSEENLVNLSNVFDFEWEKIFMVSNEELYNIDFEKEFGFDCKVIPYEKEPFNVLILLNENKCVHSFYYDYRYITFEMKENIISKENSLLKLEKTAKKIILRNI